MAFAYEPETTADVVVKNEAFYPDLSIQEFQAGYRMPKSYADSVIESELISAAFSINHELNDWQLEQEALGYSTLLAVPAKTIGERSVLSVHYKKAVYCFAKAALLKNMISMEQYKNSKNVSEDAPDLHSTYKKQSSIALARITGKSFINVELL